jgi:hypothetical protein
MNVAGLPCPACGEVVRPGDEFCASCGAEVTEELRAELRKLAQRDGRRHAIGSFAARSRRSKVAKASKWILILGILFAVFGTAFGFLAKSTADDALRILSEYEDTDLYEVEGEVKTVKEWREAVAAEPTMIFISNYVLAAVMLGAYFWARKDPFPAIVTALCVFLAVQVLSAVVDPANLYRGIVIKVLAIVAFAGGIKAALAERAAARGEVPIRRRRSSPRARRR